MFLTFFTTSQVLFHLQSLNKLSNTNSHIYNNSVKKLYCTEFWLFLPVCFRKNAVFWGNISIFFANTDSSGCILLGVRALEYKQQQFIQQRVMLTVMVITSVRGEGKKLE